MQKNVLKKLFISHKFDFALGAALLVVALCLFLVVSKLEKNGGQVTVKMNDEVIGVYSLSEDGEYEIKLTYRSPGFDVGCMISAITYLIIITSFYYNYKKRKKIASN